LQRESLSRASDNAVERARRRQEELLQQQGQDQPIGRPGVAEPQAPPTEQPALSDRPSEAQSAAEQQLEAQGDEAEANRIRTLRNRLRDELQAADEATPEDDEDAKEAGREGRRASDRRRRGDRDGDWDWGWWDYDRDEYDVVERRGTRIIIDLGGGNLYVQPLVPDEGDRLLYGAEDVEVRNLPGGRTRTIVYRDNGVQIITIRNRYGDIIERFKRLPDGREIVLIDNRFPEHYAGGPPLILYDVPPPIIRIPREQYIVDLGSASYQDIRGALLAPPVQQLARPYTLDEVLHNEQVRAYSPRIDLDTITFEFGTSTIGNDQMQALFELGQAMEQVIAERPTEVYLIEGHTDLVGSETDNLILSDERAEAVATALSQNFDIPPENLVTEGYGEQYPKVLTEGPERRNRRATIRRLTDLLQAQSR
jgi:OOP family OmpA-OmpF porin